MLKGAPGPVDVQDFQFKLRCRLKAFDNTASEPFSKTCNLVAAASRFGLFFVGSVTPSFQVIQTKVIHEAAGGELSNYPRREIPLPSPPKYLSTNCECTVLAVVFERDACPVVAFYDVKSFLQENVIKMDEARLSSTPGVDVTQVDWNPTLGPVFTACKSDGSLGMYELKSPRGLEISELPAAAGATCFCWSPKGKQIAVGSRDGNITQHKPDLKAVKMIHAPQQLPQPHALTSLQWVSNYQFIGVYQAIGGDNQACVVVVDAPKTGEPTYTNYDDICYSNGSGRPTQFYTILQQNWNVLMVGSSNSMEIGVLGLTGDSWTQWIMIDAARAELPLSPDHQETLPIGMALDISNTQNLPWGESTLPPAPILLLLSHYGNLCCFNVVNLKQGVPSICTPPDPIADTSGLRHFVQGRPAGQQAMTTAAPTVMPTILSVPQPTATFQSQPQQQQPQLQPQLHPQQQPPAHQYGEMAKVTKSKSVTFGHATSSTADVTTPPASIFSGGIQQPPVSSQGQSFGQCTITPISKQSGLPKTSGFPMYEVPGNTSTKPFEQKKLVVEPPPPTAVPPPPVNTPVTKQPILPKVEEAIGKIAMPPIDVPKGAVEDDDKNDAETEAIFAQMVRAECIYLESELKAVLHQSKTLNINLGTDADMTNIVKTTQALEEFLKEIVDISNGQNAEIHTLKQNLLQSFAWYEQAMSRQVMTKDEKMAMILRAQPLDAASEKQLHDIRHASYYLKSQLAQANAALDEQWEQFQDFCKKTRKLQMPTLEVIFQTMMKQNVILQKQNYVLKDIASKIKTKSRASLGPSLLVSLDSAEDVERELQSLRLGPDDIYQIQYERVLNRTKSLSKPKVDSLRTFLKGRRIAKVSTLKPDLSNVSAMSPAGKLKQLSMLGAKIDSFAEIDKQHQQQQHQQRQMQQTQPQLPQQQKQQPKPEFVQSTPKVPQKIPNFSLGFAQTPPTSDFGMLSNVTARSNPLEAMQRLSQYPTSGDKAVKEATSSSNFIPVSTFGGNATLPSSPNSAFVPTTLSWTPPSGNAKPWAPTSSATVKPFSKGFNLGGASATPTAAAAVVVSKPSVSQKTTFSFATGGVAPLPNDPRTTLSSNIFGSSTAKPLFGGATAAPAPKTSVGSIFAAAASKHFSASPPASAPAETVTIEISTKSVAEPKTGAVFETKPKVGEAKTTFTSEPNKVFEAAKPKSSDAQLMFSFGSHGTTSPTTPSFDTLKSIKPEATMLFGGGATIFAVTTTTTTAASTTKASIFSGATIEPVTSRPSSGSKSIFSLTTTSDPLDLSSTSAPSSTASTKTFGMSNILSSNFGSTAATTGTTSTTTTTTTSTGSFVPVTQAFGGSIGSAVSSKTSIFGSSDSQASVFPQTTHSPPTTTSTPAFGGATPSSTIFGTATSTFGAPGTTASPVFGKPTTTSTAFGTPSSTSVFGTPTSTSASVFGSSSGTVFGTPTPSTTASLFGNPNTTSTSSVFGTPTTTAFGAPVTSSVFGGASPSSATPAFAANPATSVFGAASTTTSVFGGGPTTGGSVFGAPSSTGSSIFGGSQGQTQAQSFGGQFSSTFGGTVSTPPTSQFGTTTAASPFGGASFEPAKSTSSVFGQSSTFGSAAPTTAFGGGTSAATTFGSASPFGQQGQTAPSGGSMFASSATTSTGGSIFGGSAAPATSHTAGTFGSGGSVFGSPAVAATGATSPFGVAPNQQQQQASSFSFASATASGNAANPSSFGFGSLNVGSTAPTTGFGQQETTAANPFGAKSSPFGGGGQQQQQSDNKSLFGTGSTSIFAAAASPFGGATTAGTNQGGFGSPSTFGAQSTFGQSGSSFGGAGGGSTFGSPSAPGPFSGGSSGSVQQSGFGTAAANFPKSPNPGFGAAPVFGTPSPAFGGAPSFGGSPAFGGAPTFGSPSKIFGSGTSGGGGGGFGSPSANQTAGGFGNIATQPTVGFGNIANQQTVGFGNLAQQTQSPQQNQQFSGASSFSSWR